MVQVDCWERLGLMYMAWPSSISSRAVSFGGALSIAIAMPAHPHMKTALPSSPAARSSRCGFGRGGRDSHQLSHGRLIFGVGRSGGGADFLMPTECRTPEPRPRFREILDVIEQSLDQAERVHTRASPTASMNVAVVPKPNQKPRPPIRIRGQHP